METIYTDNNATTRVAPEVYDAMVPYLTSEYYNPSSMYEKAQSVAAAVARARATIASILGNVDPDEVIFTSGATESTNLAILGTTRANPERGHIITTSVEHPAVLEVCKNLERSGHEVTFLPVDGDGNLDERGFIRALRPETLLVTIMHANNETGVIFPIEKLSRITKESDPAIIFHTDATQSVGKLPIDLRETLQHVDLFSFSGHKLHAPKGIGILYVRRGTRWRPCMIGGHQERNRRGGTENVPYIVGLAKACELAIRDQDAEGQRIRGLRDRLEQGLEERILYIGVNGKRAPRLPNTLSLACHYIEGEGILYQLDAQGICASSGSACSSGSLEPSHVLKAMKVPFTAMHGSVRFSFSRYNTEQEVERIIEVFPGIVSNLRKLSPYWDSHNNRPRPGAESMFRKRGGDGEAAGT